MNKIRSLRRLLVIGVALAALTAACGGDDGGGGSAGAGGNDTGTGGGGELADEQVLRVRLADFPDSLDPAFIDRFDGEQIALNIFNGLVSYDTEGGFVPALAEEWESNEDLTEWTFTLRDGVEFHHDYGEMTAEDVVFSYERVMDPEVGSILAPVFENIDTVTAADDHTVVITLDAPDANFLHNVTGFQQGNIVSKAAVEELGDEGFATQPVGTGPFSVESFNAGNATISLVRNDGYFDGPATLTAVELSQVEDNEAAAIALENGEFDVAMDITGDTRLEQLEGAGFVVHRREHRATTITMLNPETQPAFADERVRKAMMHAIDFQTMIDTLVPLREDLAINIFPVTLPEYTEDVATYEYDPELARELLAEAGYEDGFTVKRLIRGSDGVEDRDLLEQEMLAEVGINVEFDTVEVGAFSERRFNGDFEMATRSVPEPNVDFVATSLLHPSQFPPGGLNGSYYDNPEVTELIETARATADEAERTELYHEIQRIVMDEVPYLPESTFTSFWPSWDYVDGVELTRTATMSFHSIRLLAQG